MTKEIEYSFGKTEVKWQDLWSSSGAFVFKGDVTLEKYYVLEMLPYPSGNLHMGHVRNYSAGDVIARFKRMQGFDVLYTIGWDAFGLPAENAAIENNKQPMDWTMENIFRMRSQLKKLGFSYEWQRETTTCAPDYYKHEQLMFIKFFQKGIAYKKEGIVNWDPVDKTVLANEQVVDGKGWRSGVTVEKKKLSQWFLKISDYSEKLLQNISKLDKWPRKIRQMQTNWIGKSFGANVIFEINDANHLKTKNLTVFTTRPDTLFGASFIAISTGHPLTEEICKVNENAAKFVLEHELKDVGTTKFGIHTGLYVNHVFDGLDHNGEGIILPKLPIYVANFVEAGYGTGAIFGCPAHDARDFEFAQKYNLPITSVVISQGHDSSTELPYTQAGIMKNSYFLDNLFTEEAKKEAIAKLELIGKGSSKTTYKLRDWGVSRQRYWGCPIPMVYCDSCGIVPENENNLPIELPTDAVFDGRGSPLENHPTWKICKCPKCGSPAKRETDTLDTFFESSWYFLRYISPQMEESPFDKNEVKRIMPVDEYIGGIEHAILHLLYARFFMYALKDVDMVDIEEPFARLTTQGMVCHRAFQTQDLKWINPADVESRPDGKFYYQDQEVRDAGVVKMSKSKKNVVNPDDVVAEHGVDAVRLFILSDTPFDFDIEWSDVKIRASKKYINKLWNMANAIVSMVEGPDNAEGTESLRALTNKTVHNFTNYIEIFEFNKAIASIHALSNQISLAINANVSKGILLHVFGIMIKLLSPITPHVCSEIWSILTNGKLLHQEPWPSLDRAEKDATISIGVQVNGKLRGEISISPNALKEEYKKAALADAKVANFLGSMEIKKIIVVPAKIVNIVATEKK